MVQIVAEIKDENVRLQERIAALEKALETHEADAKQALEARIARLRTGSNSYDFPGGNKQTGLCPAGKFMVGARTQDDPGHAHGIISFIGPICRDLP